MHNNLLKCIILEWVRTIYPSKNQLLSAVRRSVEEVDCGGIINSSDIEDDFTMRFIDWCEDEEIGPINFFAASDLMDEVLGPSIQTVFKEIDR